MIWRRERDSRLGRRRGLVLRIANKPPHSGHRSRFTYALTHLTMRKQWISTVCRTALFVGKQRVSAVLSSVESSDLRRQSLLASPEPLILCSKNIPPRGFLPLGGIWRRLSDFVRTQREGRSRSGTFPDLLFYIFDIRFGKTFR